MKHYKVVCIMGHRGTGNNNSEIVFCFKAKDIIEAQDRAKKMPAVKHTKGILLAKEITFEEYQILSERNAYMVANGVRYKHRVTKP